MALQIRRGTDSDRSTQIANFKAGELIYTTDNKELWVAAGGSVMTKINAVKSVNTQTGDVVLTTDQVTQGTTNKYYSSTLARTDAGAALVGGNAGNTGITFSYNSGTNTISATVTATGGGGISAVQQDTNPSLGGNLNLNSRNITGTGNINISGNATVTSVVLGSTTIDANTITFAGANNLLTLNHGALKISSDVADANKGLYLYGSTTSSTATASSVNVFSSRGTVASPTIAVDGDIINVYNMNTYNGSAYQASAGMLFTVDGTVTNGGQIPSKFLLSVGDGTNPLGTVSMSFNKVGTLNAPIFQTGSYTTTQMNAIPSPVAGMIIFNTTVSHFMGYNGSGWVAFTGP